MNSSAFLEYVYLRAHLVEPKTIAVQVLWWIPFTLLTFLIVRLATAVPSFSTALSAGGQLFGLAAFPLFSLIFPWFLFCPFRLASNRLWLAFEAAFVITCGVTYRLRKWPPGVLPALVVPLSHFALWAWATGSWVNPLRELHVYGFWSLGAWISLMFYFGFSMLGFLASLPWGRTEAPQGQGLQESDPSFTRIAMPS
jgi:hypothetical protein